MEQRDVRRGREHAAGQHDGLAADAVGQPAEQQEERRAEHERARDQQVRERRVELQRLREEEQRVELACVPDDGLARRGAEQREQHELRVAGEEALAQRRMRYLAALLHRREQRRLRELQANPHGHAQQHGRQQERHAPAPGLELLGPEREAALQDDEQREEQPERRRRLDEARVQAALAVRRVLGDVRRGAAVFAAEREPLQQAQRDQQDRRSDANGRVSRQQADQERRRAHDHDRHEERVLAPDLVADPPEHERAERPHREARREREQRHDERARFLERREELLCHHRRERTVEVEVVPLEHRAEARRHDHAAMAGADSFPAHVRHRVPPVPRACCDCDRARPMMSIRARATLRRTRSDARSASHSGCDSPVSRLAMS